MTDQTSPVVADESAAPNSQVIEPREGDVGAQGRGAKLPEGEQPKEKQLSTREAIAKAFDESEKAAKEADKEPAKAEEEPKADAKADKAKAEEPKADKAEDAAKAEETDKAKPTRGEDGKFAKQTAEDGTTDKSAPEQAAAERGAPDDRQSEGRKYSEPPARFLPEAREKWANVPTSVKADFHRIMQEVDTETEKNKHAVERYEAIRQYDEMVGRSGRKLEDSLARVVQVEQALKQNPIAGLDAVLQQLGPRKQDGSPLTIMDVAGYLAKNPQAYQQNAQAPAQQQARQQAQSDPEIAALRAEINTMKVQSVAPMIQKFAQSHTDFPTLENQIGEILNSGIIEKIYGASLSPEQKLSEAYRMAGGRMSPSQSVEPEAEPANSRAPKDRPVDPDGQKSINGAPTSGKTAQTAKRFKTNREALEAAFASAL